jgi:hypothetical protein
MDFVVTGDIIQVYAPQTGVSQSGKAWMKQEYLIRYEGGQFPKDLVFMVFGEEKIKQFGISVQEQLTVHLNIIANTGRDGRAYNRVEAWKVERATQSDAAPQYTNQPYGGNGGGFYPPSGQPQGSQPQAGYSGIPPR